MEAFKPGLGKLGELPCKNNPFFHSTLHPFLKEGIISTQSFTPEEVVLRINGAL